MATIPATEAQSRFGALIDQARREPVIISKQGRSVAVMLSIERFTELESLEAESQQGLSEEHQAARNRALKALRKPKALGGDKFQRDGIHEERVDRWS